MDQLGTPLLVVVLGLVLKEVIVLGRHLRNGKHGRDPELNALAVMVSDVNARLTNLQGEFGRMRDLVDRVAKDISDIQLSLAELGFRHGRGGAG